MDEGKCGESMVTWRTDGLYALIWLSYYSQRERWRNRPITFSACFLSNTPLCHI